MHNQPTSSRKVMVQAGLLGGAISLLLALVGMVASFNHRFIINGVITMGQVIFLAPILLVSLKAVQRVTPGTRGQVFGYGILAGVLGTLVLAMLVLIGNLINIRLMFINASPELYGILTFGQSLGLGIILLLAMGAFLGVIAGIIYLLPDRWCSAISRATLWVLMIGLLRDLIVTVAFRWGIIGELIQWLFATSGLTVLSAVILFIGFAALEYWQFERRKLIAARPKVKPTPLRRGLTIGGAAIVLLLLPPILGVFFAEILDNVGLYILMGLGLNIVVGFAGLLDLGYVAFYAIGAYVMGVLTSPELGGTMTYWEALPFALVACVMAGFLLGLPVLKMRGDYLAIVTLGFGEIVRLLALSDWLRPWLGGSQGIQQIAVPRIGSLELNTQAELYYLFLIGIGMVAFVAWRLKDSRIGRAWMALREDEDVAQAMGINHVATKLLAFATGALFSGLAGTIFAAKLTSVYPHSMNFLVSINVLSLIIIGGMGSIPGVFVGALVLIGAPELLREFAEYRYLVYGVLLAVMMLTRPEGLWPEERRKLELHEAQEAAAEPSPVPVGQ